ncbi:MAG: hypothetical protein FWC61_03165 [Proteobacteria bacterium]|nr:hypothetical protein [Pseudomonadota bacterium]
MKYKNGMVIGTFFLTGLVGFWACSDKNAKLVSGVVVDKGNNREDPVGSGEVVVTGDNYYYIMLQDSGGKREPVRVDQRDYEKIFYNDTVDAKQASSHFWYRDKILTIRPYKGK